MKSLTNFRHIISLAATALVFTAVLGVHSSEDGETVLVSVSTQTSAQTRQRIDQALMGLPYRLVVVDRHSSTAMFAMQTGDEATKLAESVATAAGGRAIVETALEHYGRLDVLVHNAGIVRRGSLKEMTTDDFDAVLDVHLRGAFHVVRPSRWSQALQAERPW